ncbi:MAG: TonB-dependent receptor, partial [Sphingomonadaceae bacterium]
GLNLFAGIGYQNDKYRFDADAPAIDAYGVQSVPVQQANCLAELASGLIPNTTGADNALSCGVGIVAPGGAIAEPVRTPDWTVSFGGSYDMYLGGGLSIIPSINANWRSKSETGTNNVTLYDGDIVGPNTGNVYSANTIGLGNTILPMTGSFSDKRWIVNAALTLRSEGGWSLIAECKNCLDKESVESSLANYSYLNSPRSWMVRAKYEF